MRLSLSPHPTTPCQAVETIEVTVERPGPGSVSLTYAVTGRIAGLALPMQAPALRTDELWRHTCFEAFARRPGGEDYAEFNFAPSTQWAAYAFDGYRSGMRPAPIAPPRIALAAEAARLQLRAVLDLPNETWRLGLSAVIEEEGGRISYWALAHPPGRPDFHHPDCFAAELRAPQRP